MGIKGYSTYGLSICMWCMKLKIQAKIDWKNEIWLYGSFNYYSLIFVAFVYRTRMGLRILRLQNIYSLCLAHINYLLLQTLFLSKSVPALTHVDQYIPVNFANFDSERIHEDEIFKWQHLLHFFSNHKIANPQPCYWHFNCMHT